MRALAVREQGGLEWDVEEIHRQMNRLEEGGDRVKEVAKWCQEAVLEKGCPV